MQKIKDKNDIKKILNLLKNEIRKNYKAEIVGIFGSYARGEQKRKSDLDIIVKFSEGATLFDFVGLGVFLEKKLKLKVDIVPYDSIREELKKVILKEAIYI